MKISKVIFGLDDNPIYADFWPIQAKLVREVLKAEPVLFHITNEDSDFYKDAHGGIVKKINKNNCSDIITSFQSQVVRMYATKYFPDEICLTADIDMLMISEDYFVKQIENIDDESLIIMDSKAYDLERIECQNHNESCENRYPICYIIGKGKNFNKVLNTDRSFEEYVDALQKLNLGWGTDELYFGDKVDNTNHGINVVKLVRNWTTPWKSEKRIDRHNFPTANLNSILIESQKRDGIYDIDKLKSGYYIDAHCPRTYNDYKKEINELVDIILKNKPMNIENFEWGWMDEPSNVYHIYPDGSHKHMGQYHKESLTKEIFIDKCYERFFEVEKDDIVVDIGASVGPFTYSILHKKPKHVFCFEPSEREFKILVKNIIGSPATPINKGISSVNSTVENDHLFGGESSMEAITFQKFIELYSIEKIDFLKVDCEGGEFDIFTQENLEWIKNNVKKITGEWHIRLHNHDYVEKFRFFRDVFLKEFPNHEVYSIDNVNIKWDLWNEHFLEHYKQVIIHIDNRKD